eukprot:146319_1
MPIAEEDSDEGISEDDDMSSSDDVSEGVPDIVDFENPNSPYEINVKVISERFHEMYLTKGYRQASAVFGTMIAFFMIAVRVELILLDICSKKKK